MEFPVTGSRQGVLSLSPFQRHICWILLLSTCSYSRMASITIILKVVCYGLENCLTYGQWYWLIIINHCEYFRIFFFISWYQKFRNAFSLSMYCNNIIIYNFILVSESTTFSSFRWSIVVIHTRIKLCVLTLSRTFIASMYVADIYDAFSRVQLGIICFCAGAHP